MARESGEGALVERREVLVGAGAVAGLFAVGGAVKVVGGSAQLMRPPGAQSESLLLGACVRCDRCRSACPTGAIDVAHVEDGLVNARTPVMSFRKGYCDFCEKRGSYACVDACPTGAIAAGFDPSRDKIGLAVVDTSECLLYRGASSTCSKQCIAACPFDALHLDEAGGLVVDKERCNGCGACEYACPSASYAVYTASGRRGINVLPESEVR
ncbi:MAG: 4Fe-4S dicluster domain-containing protein [Coriobacteriaceae bacterium]|jgi:ferredoxin-type protein NapG|nr:4Fe-4S dicluster domain-containing protein [Coriobacteriaceae bacterium]